MKPLDVLLIAALKEEKAALEMWFPNYEETAEKVDLDVEWVEYESRLSIGLYCIEKPGGVASGVRSSKVISAFRPKVVFLVGIAGGDRYRDEEESVPLFSLGSVGYNRNIYYYSYGKADPGSEEFFRMKPLTLSGNPWLAKCAGAVQLTDWVPRAKAWFKKVDQRQWRRDYDISEDVPAQKWPSGGTGSLLAHQADIASGELVINRPELKKEIKSHFPGAEPQMFDMEAYAVGEACNELEIPFLTVKAILDFADGQKNDTYRLCATITASSFTSCIINTERFLRRLRRLRRSEVDLVKSCVIEEVVTPCPSNNRECLDIQINVLGAEVSPVSRAYEKVEPDDFSNGLRDYIRSYRATENFTFFFPYSPAELLSFFLRHAVGKRMELVNKVKWVNQQMPLLRHMLELDRPHKLDYYRKRIAAVGKTRREGRQLANFIMYLKDIAELAREEFGHFAESERAYEEIRRQSRPHDRGYARLSINRVVVMKDELPTQDRFRANPLNLLYFYFLKDIIPTYWVSASVFQRKGYPIDDLTFCERVLCDVERLSEAETIGRLLVLRFFERSRLLVVTGWPCPATDKDPGSLGGPRHLLNARHGWMRRLEAHIRNGESLSPFQEFKHDDLLESLDGFGIS